NGAAVDDTARAVVIDDAAVPGGLDRRVEHGQVRGAQAGDAVSAAGDLKIPDDDAVRCDHDGVDVGIGAVDYAGLAAQRNVVTIDPYRLVALTADDDDEWLALIAERERLCDRQSGAAIHVDCLGWLCGERRSACREQNHARENLLLHDPSPQELLRKSGPLAQRA